MRAVRGAGVALILLLVAGPATAQTVRVELRAGAAIGNYSETQAALDVLPEPAYAAVVEVEAREGLAAYAGFTRSSFGCEEGFCTNRDVSLTTQGIVAGGRWSPGWAWVRAGLAVQSLDIDGEGASDSSDAGLGFDLGAGLALDIGRGVELRPGITYLRHQANTDLGDGHVAVLAFQIGFAAEVASF